MNGAKAHIGLAPEVTYGTAVPATIYVPFTSEGIKEEIEQIADPAIRTTLDENEVQLGLHRYSGDIATQAYPDVIGHLLRSALGAPTTTQLVPAAAYSHVFQPVDTDFAGLCALPPLTLEVNRDLAQSVQYAGCVVDGFSFKVGQGSKLAEFVWNLICSKRATLAKTVPSFGTVAPFLWRHLAFKIGATAVADVEDVSIAYKNGLTGKATCDGGIEINRIVRDAKRTIDLDVTLDLTDETEYNKFLAGTNGAWEVLLEGGVVADPNKFTLKFEFPRVKYASFPINVGGPKRLTVGAKAKPFYDATAGYAMKVTLINGTASY